MELKKIVYSVENGVAVVAMNFPGNLNAIDEQMADDLILALQAADKDPEVKVILLKSLGKAFSAGGDIGYFYQLVKAGGDVNMDGLIAKVGVVADLMKKTGKPVVTAVNGAAAGAGFSLAIGGDFMVCADNAQLILAFVNLGLVPDTGATYLLAKSIGASRAIRYAMLGTPIKADEALDLGLAYKVVPKEELEAEAMKLCAKLAKGPLTSYANSKKQVYDASFSDYAKWLAETEVPTQAVCSATEDFKEGVCAFMEKRKPVWQGK
ncbi:MAG: enoyl-CoA hydratase/isomerase family protein [Oscillospiraceae bacterium]|nr:enoyl-CoA hydratase/isomerase family protein [Oscillospiraceae bacterium]